MRDRCYIFNCGYLQSCQCQGTDGHFTAAARTFDTDLDPDQSGIHCFACRHFRRLSRGKRCAFPGTLEAEASRRSP